MTTNDLTYEAVAELARRNKRELAARWQPGMDDEQADLLTHAVVVRNGRNVALVFAGPSGVMSSRRAGYIAAATMRPDQLYVVCDMVRATAVNGVRPVAGELVARWQAGDREGLTEALMLQRFDRTGLLDGVDYPYVRTGATVTWGRPRVIPGAELGGEIAEYVAAGWAEGERLRAGMQGLPTVDLPPDRLEHYEDRACARHASTMDGGMVSLLDSDTRFINGQEVLL